MPPMSSACLLLSGKPFAWLHLPPAPCHLLPLHAPASVITGMRFPARLPKRDPMSCYAYLMGPTVSQCFQCRHLLPPPASVITGMRFLAKRDRVPYCACRIGPTVSQCFQCCQSLSTTVPLPPVNPVMPRHIFSQARCRVMSGVRELYLGSRACTRLTHCRALASGMSIAGTCPPTMLE
jgi:hypothetical protein